LANHPKFRRAVHILGETRAHVRGHLELLWDVAYESGNPRIGDITDVELAADWQGKPGLLCNAFLHCGGEGRAGFLEELADEPGCFAVHDLCDHAPEYVKKRMERETQRRQRGKTIEQIRSDAARQAAQARWQQSNAKRMPDDASCMPRGTTPTPAPAPAPAPSTLKKTTSSRPKLRFDEADKATAVWMFSLIQALDPKAKEPNFDKWANTIRLMRETDQRSDMEIRTVFQWANADSFWRANILSADKLREKFPQLCLKMKGEKNEPSRNNPGCVFDPDATG
jgi:hypothetical protein